MRKMLVAILTLMLGFLLQTGRAVDARRHRDAAVARADSLTILVDDLRSNAVVDSINIANMSVMLDEWNAYFFTGKVPSSARVAPMDSFRVNRRWLKAHLPCNSAIDSVKLYFFFNPCSLNWNPGTPCSLRAR